MIPELVSFLAVRAHHASSNLATLRDSIDKRQQVSSLATSILTQKGCQWKHRHPTLKIKQTWVIVGKHEFVWFVRVSMCVCVCCHKTGFNLQFWTAPYCRVPMISPYHGWYYSSVCPNKKKRHLPLIKCTKEETSFVHQGHYIYIYRNGACIHVGLFTKV